MTKKAATTKASGKGATAGTGGGKSGDMPVEAKGAGKVVDIKTKGMIETTGAWTCPKCGRFNNPNDKGFKKGQCQQCGAAEPPEDKKMPPERIEKLGKALVNQAHDAGGVEEVSRREEGVSAKPPANRPLPLHTLTDKGEFDALGALEQLHQLRLVVIQCQLEHIELQKKTKAAGGRLDDATEKYFELFDSIFETKEKVAKTPGIDFTKDVNAGFPECQVQKEMQAPCPACASARAKGKPPATDDPLHPNHPKHDEIARSLLVKDMDDLRIRLEKKNFFITLAELKLINVGDLNQLQRFAAQRQGVPAPCLTKAHIAAAAGTNRQECKHCGLKLMDQVDVDHGAKYYPALAAVGLDCPGKPADASADGARKPLSHAKKDGKTRANPEDERKSQTAEGRKKAAAKSTKKR